MKKQHKSKTHTLCIKLDADLSQYLLNWLEEPQQPKVPLLQTARPSHLPELIRIDTNPQGELVVSARELHEFLEVKTKFADWIQSRIKEYEFTVGVDFVPFSENSEKGVRPRKEYALTLDTAKELSMVERTAKGKEARQYFIACEKSLRQLTSKPAMNEPVPVALQLINVTRIRVRNLVTSYSRIKGCTEQAVWRLLYTYLLKEHRIKVWAHERLEDENFLDVLERKGHLEKIYTIANRELSPFL